MSKSLLTRLKKLQSHTNTVFMFGTAFIEKSEDNTFTSKISISTKDYSKKTETVITAAAREETLQKTEEHFAV